MAVADLAGSLTIRASVGRQFDVRHGNALFPNGRNRLIEGDCGDVIRRLPDECVDLIYIDPPFLTGRQHYATLNGSAREEPYFDDRWEGGLDAYLEWIEPRLREMQRVLTKTGSIYVHLDWRTSHYVKCLCDRIFGPENFRNEIYWKRDVAGKGAKRVSRQWPRNVDNILFYTKSAVWHFRQAYVALDSKQQKNYRYIESDGRRFKTVMLGDYSAKSIARMEGEGLIYTSKSGKKYKKYYLDEAMSTVDTLWADIPGFGTRTASRERLGYPTQKPEALLRRIVEASSREGDVVADFCCGSGTTCAVAHVLGRAWIGVDVSRDAIDVSTERLSSLQQAVDPCAEAKQASLFMQDAAPAPRPIAGFDVEELLQ
jgi:DNA modification methylase